MKTLSVLIKPSSNVCNLDCKYCFYNDETKKRERNKGTFMNIGTLESIVKKAFAFADQHITFVFQGGEPTLMGLDFYQAFLRFVNKYNINNCKTEYSIQTNGILLDQEWIQFLKDNRFLVGISMDGLPEIHDMHRVNAEGKKSHRMVTEAIEQMVQKQIPFHVLMVVTKPLVERVKETYEYLKKMKISFLQIIPVLDPLFEGQNNYEYSLSKEAWGRFLVELFDLWYTDFLQHKEIRITYFENIIYKMMGNSHVSCAMNGKCSIQMVIEGNGAVYPCDFYVIDRWELGNINQDSFIDILQSSRAKDFVENSEESNERCKTCKWFGLCMGSCKRYQLGKFDYTAYYCESYQTFFEHAENNLRVIANTLLKKQN